MFDGCWYITYLFICLSVTQLAYKLQEITGLRQCSEYTEDIKVDQLKSAEWTWMNVSLTDFTEEFWAKIKRGSNYSNINYLKGTTSIHLLKTFLFEMKTTNSRSCFRKRSFPFFRTSGINLYSFFEDSHSAPALPNMFFQRQFFPLEKSGKEPTCQCS